MRNLRLMLLLGVVALAAGCAGMSGSVASFQAVDLSQDLDHTTLARYQGEMQKAHESSSGASSEHSGHMMMSLESSDGRALGLLAYWDKGSVTAMHSSTGGVHYMVSRTLGIGPLALLYASEAHAVYGEDGKRQSYMDMDSVVWGHVAMFHTMGSKLDDGQWMEHGSSHVAHHLLNFGEGHEGGSFSFGSAPNAMGFDY